MLGSQCVPLVQNLVRLEGVKAERAAATQFAEQLRAAEVCNSENHATSFSPQPACTCSTIIVGATASPNVGKALEEMDAEI